MANVLGLIGGSGLYQMDGLRDVEEVRVETPYGPPSDAIVRAQLATGDATLLFVPRHGRGHKHPPSAINYRANICALKKLGATHVLSVSAVGSMKDEIAPGDLVVVDQFIDMTRRRISTFFDEVAGHVPFADPVCSILAGAVARAAESAIERAAPKEGGRARVHRSGTYVCIEGPQFSSRAESHMYRSFGVSVIGMTNMPEAKLAREAALPYATLALATDYDCWHESEEAVSVDAVLATLRGAIGLAAETARTLLGALPDVSASAARRALDGAVMTAPGAASPEARGKLDWLLGPA